MNLKVYFSGSIRGGRTDVNLYHEMIGHIQKTDTVLTEQVGNPSHSVQEGELDRDQAIYAKDTTWIRECDLVIAECTSPSLGVGYELAYAEQMNKPCYILYDQSRTNLSAMLRGNPYFTVIPYEKKDEAIRAIEEILQKHMEKQ